MTSSDSVLLLFFSALAAFGAFVVTIGVILEGAEYGVKWGKKRKFRKWVGEIFEKERRRKLVILVKWLEPKILPVETLGFAILVFGLAIELLGSFSAERLQSKENATLESIAAQANERTSSNELQVAILESNNLVLRSNVAVLEKAVEWRTITPTQEKILIALLKPIAQAQHIFTTNLVIVDVDKTDFEAERYATRITSVLRECGFPVSFTPNIWWHPEEYRNRVGLEIYGDGMNSASFEQVIFSAFAQANVSDLGHPIIRTNGVNNGSGLVHIWVFHKPET